MVDTKTVEFNTTDKQTYMYDNRQISYQSISLKKKTVYGYITIAQTLYKKGCGCLHKVNFLTLVSSCPTLLAAEAAQGHKADDRTTDD